MIPTTPNGMTEPPAEPKLINRSRIPRGVLQKHLKSYIYFGAVLVLVLAMFFSAGKKPGATDTTKDTNPTPQVQDNTANNVAALQAQLAQEKQQQQEATLAVAAANYGTPAQQAAAAGLGANGQAPPAAYAGGSVPPNTQNSAQPQLSPEEQQAQQLAAKERERQYASRFESNLVYSRSAQQAQAEQQGSAAQVNPYAVAPQSRQPTNLTPSRAAGEPAAPGEAASYKRAAEVNLDTAVGQPYVIYEGLTLEAVINFASR